MKRLQNRRGFTLIELLVVMALIILLAAIVISVSYSGLIDNYRTIGAGDRVSKWLVIAKVKAQRDQVPCGVRFYVGTDGMIREAQYIQVPEPYVPTYILTDLNKTPPVAVIDTTGTITILNVTQTTVTNNVTVGDTLVLPEFNLLLRVNGIANGSALNSITLTVTNTLLPALPPNGKYSTTAFGFLRAAQPMAGEEMLLLTGQTAIDPTLCSPVISSASGTQSDILFTPQGEVLNSTTGSTILWVRDPSLPKGVTLTTANLVANYDAAGQMGLITVYTKTGSVATHPVTRSADPYAATKDGINTGL
jgi:prepilin-type N-terminal cleavage/methylation domain-containing protein